MPEKKDHPAERDAGTGRFVEKGTAARRPATTLKERVPNPGHGTTKSGGSRGGSRSGKR